MTTLDERKKNRWLMLRKFYELANGRADNEIIDMWQVGEELGWDRETTETTYDYLQGEGLLKAMTLGGGATITHQGVQEVQKAEEQPQEPTLHFPAFIANIRMPPEKREDDEVLEEGQATSRRSDVDSLAATGTFGSPGSLVDEQAQQLPAFEEQVRQIVTSFNLPYAKRMIAQQMSLEAIRIICRGLKEAE